MVKNLIAASLLAAAPLAANNTVYTYNANVKYDNWGTEFSDLEYYQETLEAAKYIKFRNQTPITNYTNIGNIQQFVIQYDQIDITASTDKYLKHIYIYSYLTNKVDKIRQMQFNLEGTIVADAPNRYEDITIINSKSTNAITNPNVINMFNGTQPTNFTAARDLIDNNGMTGAYTQGYSVTSINDLKNTIDLGQSNTIENFYTITEILIRYRDTYITTVTKNQDTYYFPSGNNFEISYTTNATPTYEVVDIPGLMFEILGMPFAWISTAFDLTIFPNTPYAINLSHIFMAVIVAGISIFIIKRILK